MAAVNHRRLLGGVLMLSIGAFVATWGAIHYDLGSLSWPGPGLFPMALGVILSLLGGGIALTSLRKPSVAEQESSSVGTDGIDLRACLMVTAGIVAFGMTIRQFGLLPSILLTTLLAKFADDRLSMVGALTLAGVLSAMAYLVFVIWLGTPMSAIRLPR